MRSLCFHNCIYKAPNLLGLLEYLRVRDPNYELNNHILESFLKKKKVPWKSSKQQIIKMLVTFLHLNPLRNNFRRPQFNSWVGKIQNNVKIWTYLFG